MKSYSLENSIRESIFRKDLFLYNWLQIYFFYMSTTPMLRKTHLEHFLGYYHDQFVTCLHKLGEDPTVYPYRYEHKNYRLTRQVDF